MKKLNIKGIIAVAVSVVFLASCASNESFTAQKYTHFRKNNGVLVMNKTKRKNTVSQNIEQKAPALASHPAAPAKKTTARHINNIKDVSTHQVFTKKARAVKQPVINRSIESKTGKNNDQASVTRFYRSKTVAAPMDGSQDQELQIVCAILIPPLGVYLHDKGITSNFWIDLLLCFLFYFPGMVFALLVVLNYI